MNAPTVTMADIQLKIEKTIYMRIPDTTVTICMITLKNGFSVRGESACVSPENYNQAVGEKYAFENAFDKLWQLEGYLLAERLYQQRKIAELGLGLGSGSATTAPVLSLVKTPAEEPTL